MKLWLLVSTFNNFYPAAESVGFLRRGGIFQNPRQRYIQMEPSLPESDATFEQQSTNLVDDLRADASPDAPVASKK